LKPRNEEQVQKPVRLGPDQRVAVEQDEQGNVLLWTTDPNTPFALSPDEALDLLRWLFARQDKFNDTMPTGKLDPSEQG
jgi:hypothetical protein